MTCGKNIIAALVTTTLLCTAPALAQTNELAPANKCPLFSWTTLGTAAGPVPAKDRSEPANLLRAGDLSILVDTGDGAANKLAEAGLQIGAISNVLISHHHMDHTGGLGAIIGLRWMVGVPETLTVYGPPGTQKMVDGIIASMSPHALVGFGTGQKPLPPSESVSVIELSGGDVANIGEITVSAISNTHFSNGDNNKNDVSPQSLSYRFDFGNRTISYTGDTGPSKAVTKIAKGSDLLVSEVIELDSLVAEITANYQQMPDATKKSLRKHLSEHHLESEDVGKMAAEAKVKQLVLTHFAIPSRPLADSASSIRDGVEKFFSGPLELAADLSTYTLDCE